MNVQGYHLEEERIIRNYHRWLKLQKMGSQDTADWNFKVKFSVIIPVYNTVTEQLKACVESVLAQTYENFELILVDDHSSWDNVIPVLKEYEQNEKVKVIYRTENGHISKATNDGIERALGDYIVFMDCDDTIEPDAFYEFAKVIHEDPDVDFIYSDEDKITEDGKIRHMAFFKPDWSPDLYLNMNYTNHLSVYRASIVKKTGGLRSEYNGSQDYDFVLRFMEKSDYRKVKHIPKILYHWRERKESAAYAADAKNYAADAARRAKEDYIRRNGIKAHLEYIGEMAQYRVVYEVVGNPKVSMIIPSKDHPEVLKQCIDSIKKFTTYDNYEIIVVDNGSSVTNQRILESYLAENNVRYFYEKMEFNFSKMCNTGAACAKGEFFLFLNDDIELRHDGWLERMLGHAQQKHVGAVGAKLYYPNTTKIQHMGVSNPEDGPTHSFWLQDDKNPFYFGWNRVDQNCIAVTGACLMVDRKKFEEIGGFDEKLAVTYNDVKLCLALHKKGYYNVLRNDVTAYHHESLSRGFDYEDDEKFIRLHRERMKLFAEFPELNGNDPYMNRNLMHYNRDLELKSCHDILQEMDLSETELSGVAHIDQIDINEYVRVAGWSYVGGEGDIRELERFLIFQDPFGGTYGAKVLSVARPDVAEHLGVEDCLYAGYEGVLLKTQIRFEQMPYKIGVLTIGKDSRKHLCWCETTFIYRRPKQKPFAMKKEQVTDYGKYHEAVPVHWSIDECECQESYYKIRGFAFRAGKAHHNYVNSLIFSDRQGNAWEFEIQPEERIDVTYTFPKEHFLHDTGFVSYIFEHMLKSGEEYEIIIRMRNQFDGDDIIDIATGRTVII